MNIPFLYKSVATSTYTHPVLGRIHVKVHGTARSIHARWDSAQLLVTVPRKLPLDMYEAFINNNVQKLLEMKPAQAFRAGQIIDGNTVDFEISTEPCPLHRGAFFDFNSKTPVRGKKANCIIRLAPGLHEKGIETPYVQDFLKDALVAAAAKAVRRYVIPRAIELADIIGRHPMGWNVKYRKHALGTCDSKGIITLCPRLIFLPDNLRDFVILHELAHLSEMNHSRAFHDICNRYCNGQEVALRAALKTFEFPFR